MPRLYFLLLPCLRILRRAANKIRLKDFLLKSWEHEKLAATAVFLFAAKLLILVSFVGVWVSFLSKLQGGPFYWPHQNLAMFRLIFDTPDFFKCRKIIFDTPDFSKC